MASLPATITALLAKDESTTLDFKQAQYPLANATDDQKSEIIKDILAFANTARDKDAYIIIGAKERKGHPATVIGITDHLEDAHLQQLINTKTNRPIMFRYRTTTIGGKQLGVIQIPVQERFLYLKKDFGKLRANIVYLRRGSSTSMATPDDIARMGITDPPTLDVQFAHPTEHQLRGTRLQITSSLLRTPKHIPDTDTLAGLVNPNYHREAIAHTTFARFTKPVSIAITNTSTVTAHDVRITLTIPDPKRHVTITLDTPPSPHLFVTKSTPTKPPKHQVTLDRTPSMWRITARLAKVQPHATQHLPELLYVGATRSTTLTLTATIYADNLPTPITTLLTIRVIGKQRTLTLQQALKLAHHP
ncbi:MAG TPA: ATP-binding protein [Burkholderiales bacterium]|jgi:hypothetical protein|nr:ATP-binding protein [Burkholderiales bacterium]